MSAHSVSRLIAVSTRETLLFLVQSTLFLKRMNSVESMACCAASLRDYVSARDAACQPGSCFFSCKMLALRCNSKLKVHDER